MVKRALALEAANDTVDKIRGRSGEGSSDRKRKYESENASKVQQTVKKAGKAPVGGFWTKEVRSPSRSGASASEGTTLEADLERLKSVKGTALLPRWVSSGFDLSLQKEGKRQTMATRGRRGAVPTQDEGLAGGSQAPAQQAQDQTGVPLPPPPPPVDYRALMQGLVHAMQTQAQTTAALQAQVQALAYEAGFRGVSMMERFRRMTPPFFKGESDPILAESWLRETEKIFRAIRCVEEERVTLATYMLQEHADVWWSSVLCTQFADGALEVAWAEFVRLFRAKYIPEHV
ncbi:hypothetical protein Taro_039462 [Colocasia esculenta]|uniref:Gag protein n=1 Tax=Colocasia esculenta TaxID=4460 RepID=A0A843WQ93_COLES|nr:hypothetical protein [Colocasia esculenta]